MAKFGIQSAHRRIGLRTLCSYNLAPDGMRPLTVSFNPSDLILSWGALIVHFCAQNQFVLEKSPIPVSKALGLAIAESGVS